MTSSVLGIVLGVLVGLRHAFEPDHLTAVSTLVTETHGLRSSALLGALWGVGHTVSLVAVGLILMIVGETLPARAAVAFELGVAAMLLVLGVRTIALAARGATLTHAHPHLAARRRWRPVVVGLVHGLAGSGALTAIVFARLPSAGARIVYMVLFGLGSVAGMAIASGVAGATLSFFTRSGAARRWIAVATGALSIAVGVLWSIPLVTARADGSSVHRAPPTAAPAPAATR